MNRRRGPVIACTAAFVLLLTLSFFYLYNAPTAGVSIAWNDSVKRYQVTSSTHWSRLKPGDTIERIEDLEIGFLHLLKDNIYLVSGEALFSWLEAKREVFTRLNRPFVTFGIVRDGKRMDVEVMPKKAGLSFLRDIIFLHFLVGTVFFLIGMIVFYKKGPGEIRGAFLATCLTIMLVFITNATSLMSEIVYRPWYLSTMNLMNIACLPLANATLLHFTQLLPRKRRFLEKVPWLVPVFYGICIVVVVSFQVPAINFLTALMGVCTFISVVYAFFAYKEPVERQQMKWVLAGFLFGLGPWVLINAIPMLIVGRRLMADTIPASFIVFIPLSMAFAIRKFRLMDIDAFLEGTFVYAITLFLLGIGDFAFLALLGGRLSETLPFGDVFFSLILVGSLYIVLRDRTRLLIRKVFRRTARPKSHAIAALNERSSGLPPEGILKTLTGVIEEWFGPTKTALFTKGTDHSEETFRRFKGRAGLVNLWETQDYAKFLSDGFYVALVLARKGEIEFALLLGGLRGKRFYSRDDLDTLDALLVQGSALYESAILHQENLRHCAARVSEEARHAKEKEMILKDLHDGIGTIATNIHLLAELALYSSSPEQARKSLSTILDLSKEEIFEITTFLHSLDASEATFGALTAEIHNMGSTIVTPHQISFAMENGCDNTTIRPGRFFFLNVRRICREALTNVVKHSGATSVFVKMFIVDDTFVLIIEDNGVGKAGEKSRGRGLRNMEARAKSMGARIAVTSGEGTCIRVEVPLSQIPAPLKGE